MDRRNFLKGTAAALPVISLGCAGSRLVHRGPTARVRPGDPRWPSPAMWDRLNRQVDGHLIVPRSPLAACAEAGGSECPEVVGHLKNPYFLGDEPALTQSSGWVDAWRSTPSVYAVAARETAHVVAAVNFAREHNLRLVIKGGGHSYQGRSNAPDSLLIWTRAMQRVTVHDAFVGAGCEGTHDPMPAVSVGAGAIWLQAYDAVSVKGGRYVQGGGCTTVGVAGLVQSGGFGSFSKRYGTAAAGLIEAEVVTADGEVRIANACTNPSLFWGLKGGGGGSLGVVTRLILRTRELPAYVGGVFGSVTATSDPAYRELIARTLTFYRDRLFNPTWGEQLIFAHGNQLHISMVFQGLDRDAAAAVWRPFIDWLTASPADYRIAQPITTLAVPGRSFWDADFLQTHAPEVVKRDDRPNAPPGNILWAGNEGEAGRFLHGYRSAWLPASLLTDARRTELVDALFATTRLWQVSLHCNKGLAGAPPEDIAAARDTATNPEALDAFALAIIAGEDQAPAFAGIPGPGPDLERSRRRGREISRAMDTLLAVAPGAGSYFSESDYFEASWQRSFWGDNYTRLAAVKKEYDPAGLFFVHHGVGSEAWSDDGFTRRA